MDSTLLLLGFALAVLMGAALARLLVLVRPQWSSRRRLFAAAVVLPGVTLAATLLAVAWIWSLGPAQRGNMRDLAIAAVAAIGGTFVMIGFAGGTVGAFLAQRRLGR